MSLHTENETAQSIADPIPTEEEQSVKLGVEHAAQFDVLVVVVMNQHAILLFYKLNAVTNQTKNQM